MPKHPIYTAMLPESARAVMGVPHPSGRAAMRMLESEGFAHEGYVDIFDGGPTMAAPTDQIRTDPRRARVDDRPRSATSRDGQARCCSPPAGSQRFRRAAYGHVAGRGRRRSRIDAASARALLGVDRAGDAVHRRSRG